MAHYQILLFFAFISFVSAQTSLLDTYKQCVDDGIFTASIAKWLCDPESHFSNASAARLEKLLLHFQTELKCPCANETHCYRGAIPIKSAYVASLIVTNDLQNETDLDKTLGLIAKDTANSMECQNAFVFVLDTKTQQLHAYRGNETFKRLSDSKLLEILNNAAAKSARYNDTTVLTGEVLRETKTKLAGGSSMSDVSHAMVWIGIVFAIIVLVLLLVCLVLICGKAFCCKDKIDSAEASIYKYKTDTGEPIYVVTEGSMYTGIPSRPDSGYGFLDPLRQQEVQSKNIDLDPED